MILPSGRFGKVTVVSIRPADSLDSVQTVAVLTIVAPRCFGVAGTGIHEAL
jgi:hypothetical protein